MAAQDIPRERWLAHLERVVAVSEARKGRLDAAELAAIARELGLGEADLAAAQQEAEDHFTRGQGFAARGLWTDAIAELTEAHTLAPARLDISLALARAHQRRGAAADLEIADRLARMALEWEPGDQAAFSILADLDAGRRARAIRRRRLGLAGAAGLVATAALVAWLAERTGIAAALIAAALASWQSSRTGDERTAEPITPAAPPATPLPAPGEPAPRGPGAGEACPPGSAFSPGHGCVAQDVEVTPGLGFSDIRVGQSTPRDVLAVFGDDAKVSRYSSGEIFAISYDYDETGEYEPGRRRNWARPAGFDFKREVLREIDVGVYQRRLRTPGGLNTQTSTLDDALREFGDRYEFERGDPLDSYRWISHGIEVWISRETRKVNSFKIIAAETP